MHSDFPLVKGYIRAAEMHREAAATLLEASHGRLRSLLCTEVVYLSGYVVECSLKAYLLSHVPVKKHSERIEKFKANGHDLEKLLSWLAAKRRHLPDRQARNCRKVRGNWSSQMRYEARSLQRTTAESVHRSAEELYRWVLGS